MEKPLSLKRRFVIFSILASLWLLKHPYNGIWHDGVIYTFMAMKDLYPDIFTGDLFIKFGSQDNFTIFPKVYAVLIKYFGMYKSALMLTVFGQVLWIYAAVTLFRTFLKGKGLYISLAILFFMKAIYGGFNCFQYGEAFVNPRIFSEALCILGMTCIIRGKYLIAAFLFLPSFFIHPLITLCACITVYVYLIMTYPRVLFSAPILVAVICLLVFFKIEPLTGLLRVIPFEWFQIIKVRSYFMFLYQWPLNSWTELFFTVTITASACLFSEGAIRRLFMASIIGACCGMLINIIGGELLRIELIMQIQAWRSLWFLQFISALGAAVLIINFLEMKENKLLLFSFFALTWYSISLGIISFGITLIFFYLCKRTSKNDLPPIKIIRPTAFLIITIIIIFIITMPNIINMFRAFVKNDFNMELLSILAEIALFNFFLPLVLFLVIFLFYHYWEKKPDLKIIFLSITVFIFALATWDRQSLWSKVLEKDKDDKAFFRHILPQDATILWDASPEISWFGAGRQSYISSHQGSGVVFYRGTALEYTRRVNIVLPLMDENKMMIHKLGWGFDKTKFKANYSNVCRDAEELDYIISTINVPGRPIAHWRSPVPMKKNRILDDGTFEETKDQDFYLYDCDAYR